MRSMCSTSEKISVNLVFAVFCLQSCQEIRFHFSVAIGLTFSFNFFCIDTFCRPCFTVQKMCQPSRSSICKTYCLNTIFLCHFFSDLAMVPPPELNRCPRWAGRPGTDTVWPRASKSLAGAYLRGRASSGSAARRSRSVRPTRRSP